MIRISTIFVGICMVLVSASLGLVLYAIAGISGYESAIVALTALTVMILYNAVSMRIKDRTESTGQITDLSRGTADLARQVAEFGRRLAVVESKIASAGTANQDRIQTVAGEIGELGALVKQLATSVATHEDMLTAMPAPATVSAAIAPPSPPVNPVTAADVPLAVEVAEDTVTPTAPAIIVRPEATPARDNAQFTAMVKDAIADNRIDIYLQPMVTLPQRKVRFYEAMTRLRDDKDQVITADEFIGPAEAAGLMGQIDHIVLLRCMQVLRRLMVRNKDVGVFCNMAGATLSNAETFAQCIDFLEANRALAPSFVLEFKQNVFRNLGPIESEHLAALAQRGYRFSIDHVTDLRIEPRDLADRGVRFIKVPAALLLDPKQTSNSDIHPADLSDLLGRFGIDLIAERIEGERAVVDLLDFDVRFGQGFLFAAPRPLRPETPANGGAPNPAIKEPARASTDPNGPVRSAPTTPPRPEPPRSTGNAALARRATGPN
ncbi:EAL domain-containing protein [Tardiphaga sp. 37S4]|uniref:EAL domain-containing protein n=1 Tax=Tardiphaga sp. 37S4 TaxID=1404741 RepID=UPI001E2A50DF|nr:EAL domain-containing protein [Tardiphaga sp. 37S4]UFS74191.1 EAL domain-containing protein [Tardiphaga sp. 37S4]